MANNNHLVLEIVLENGRSAVLEKQQEEIKQVRKQYWDILMFVYKVLSNNGCRSPAVHVGPMYSAFVKGAALVASAEPTLLQARREELDHCKEVLERFRREIVRHMDDDDLQMWMDLMMMSVPTFQDESSH
jgi:rhamnogalacturonyl hydrolase YesR